MNAATPMDVDTHIVSIEKEKTHGESEEYEDKPVEYHDSNQYGYKDEEDRPICNMGKSSDGRIVDQRHVDGERRIRRNMPHLREDGSPMQRLLGVGGAQAKAKVNRKEKEHTPRASTDTKAATTTTLAATTTTTAACKEASS